MLTKRTVFVVGAGASAPFGFPTGRGLYDAIVRRLREQNDGFASLRDHGGFSPQDIERFRYELSRSGRVSVDGFLEHRWNHMEIGKTAIAHVLMGHEDEEQLFRNAGDWLGYLYRTLPSDFEAGDIAFLTFNYDRSLEHFLYSALKHGYGRSDTETKDALECIPIIHLHGRLGHLPWEMTAQSRLYRPEVDAAALKIGAQGIKIVHEDISDGRDKDFATARELLASADRVHFLGFGYDATNIERLGVLKLKPGTCHGTSYDFTSAEMSRLRLVTEGKIGLTNTNCLDYLRNLTDG